eukprot:3019109-Amphidinium_carterae.1
MLCACFYPLSNRKPLLAAVHGKAAFPGFVHLVNVLNDQGVSGCRVSAKTLSNSLRNSEDPCPNELL